MKNYTPKPLNAIQQARAPQSVNDESFSELREQMADEGIGHPVFTGKNAEIGTTSKTWFDGQRGKWITEFLFTDGSTDRLEANSRDDLLVAMAVGHAESVAEDHEAELEANPIFKSDYEEVVFQWLRDCKFGREFSAWSEYLPQETVDKIGQMIRQKASRMYGNGAKKDARFLEAAYCELLDAGLLDAFEKEAAKNKQVADFQATKDAEQERVTAERLAAEEAGYNNAMAEYDAEKAAKRIVGEKKLSRTAKGMSELRRRALFEAKQEHPFAVSTGTAKRN